MERDPESQLTTARMLLAQFIMQIEEFEGMNRAQRRTPRGRELTRRWQMLQDGHAKQTARIADLEEQIASQPEQENP